MNEQEKKQAFKLSALFKELAEKGTWFEVNNYHHPDYATSLTFDAAKRFAQTVTEEFQITVKAPQSISQYGVINWNQDNGIESDYDSNTWESFAAYSTPTGGTANANDYYIEQDNADYTSAIETALNIANTKIIKSHRDTQVNFETDLRLDFNLTHT
ncbi:MAG: hypothetical protein GY829_08830, partial [Gammaproteobacteria bacterium]|nr:hypothetical protein [Gammaproteobacteria bacterium]